MANRTILGEFEGDYVLRVSRPGYNVLDPDLTRDKLAFDSRWPENMNVADAGTLSLPSDQNTLTFNHGVSYSTGAICFVWLSIGGYTYMLDSTATLVGGYAYRLFVAANSFSIAAGSGHPTVTLYYVVLRNSNG